MYDHRCLARLRDDWPTTMQYRSGLTVLIRKTILKAPHSTQPAVIIARFTLHVGEHLGVRKTQEALLSERFDYRLHQRLRLQHAIHSRHTAAASVRCHSSTHCLRA